MTSRVRFAFGVMACGLIVAVPAMAAAQDRTMVGVHVGLNVATLKVAEPDDTDDLKGIIDVLAGLHVQKRFNKIIGGRAEVNFSGKGTKVETGADDAKIKLSYVDVPVLVTLGGPAGHLDFFTGPQWSFKTKAEAKFRDETASADELIRGSDVAWVVGFLIGGQSRVQLDFRYAHGLKDIGTDNSTMKTQVLSIVMGINLTK